MKIMLNIAFFEYFFIQIIGNSEKMENFTPFFCTKTLGWGVSQQESV